MKVKSKGIIIVFLCLVILGWGFYSIGKTIIIKYGGSNVDAIISQIPTECDKYNGIKVLVDETEFTVSISKKECREGVYKIGQKVVLLKHKKYDELIWPNSNPEFAILLIIGILLLGYFTTRKYYQK